MLDMPEAEASKSAAETFMLVSDFLRLGSNENAGGTMKTRQVSQPPPLFSAGTVTLPTAGQPSRESRAQSSASPGRRLTWEGGRWGLGKQATLLGAELRMRVSKSSQALAQANSWSLGPVQTPPPPLTPVAGLLALGLT